MNNTKVKFTTGASYENKTLSLWIVINGKRHEFEAPERTDKTEFQARLLIWVNSICEEPDVQKRIGESLCLDILETYL